MQTKDDTLTILLRSFKLATMANLISETLLIAEKKNWSHREMLLHLCECEAQERATKLTQRLLKLSCLPVGKTIDTLQEAFLSEKIRRQLPSLLEGNFIERHENILAFGLPGRGKTHFLAALGRELILRQNKRVFFISTFKLIGRLLTAKKEGYLEAALKKFDFFDVIILDDIGYVQQSREEMDVFFMFLAERYERSSIMITSNLVFSQWNQIFKDPMTTMAAIDRLVHHCTILEFTGESLRSKAAKEKTKE